MADTNTGIVVIGRNEGQRLIYCLESVLVTGYPIIYVDSQSTDNSVNEALSRNIEVIQLDSTKPLSAARARNEGFKRLVELNPSIKYVHFIDADCELESEWLQRASIHLERQEEVAVVCGRLREKHRNDSVYMILCDIDWYRSSGIINSCGGIATYRRSVFESLDGFNENLIAGEEPELCSRIRSNNQNILCLEAEMGTHDSAMTRFSQWWTRSVKVGYGFMSGSQWGGWGKQYKSSLFWGGLLPFFILITIFFSINLAIVFFILYPVQIYRIYSNFEGDPSLTNSERWLFSIFCVLAKFPETQGILTYYVNKVLKKNQIIQYK